MGLKIKILLFFICGISAFSQSDSILERSSIIKFPNKIITRLSLTNTSNSFHINDYGNNLNIEIEPNIRAYLGASVSFRSVQVNYGFAPDFLKSNEDNADSKLFFLNFRMFFGQWMQTLDVYNQKGFFVKIGNQKTQLSGIETFKVGGSTAYVFNKDFSFKAIQNEWQTESSGSFIPRVYYYYTRYKLEENGFDSKADSYTIAIAPSYHYNFIFHKHFIFSLGGSAGIGINHSSNLGDGSKTATVFEFSGRSVIGYNSNTFFAGANYNHSVLEFNIDHSIRQDDTIPFLEFFVGYRFNAPKKLIKFADDFNTKHGF